MCDSIFLCKISQLYMKISTLRCCHGRDFIIVLSYTPSVLGLCPFEDGLGYVTWFTEWWLYSTCNQNLKRATVASDPKMRDTGSRPQPQCAAWNRTSPADWQAHEQGKETVVACSWDFWGSILHIIIVSKMSLKHLDINLKKKIEAQNIPVTSRGSQHYWEVFYGRS